MTNIIRADIYRILRGKALYITFALLAVFSLLEVLPHGGGDQIGVNTNAIVMDFSSQTVDGAVGARLILTVMDNLTYFLIPLFVAVAMSMFSCGAVKNSLSTGMSRTRLYFSKLALSSLLCVLMMLVYGAVGVLAATALRGPGDWTEPYLLTLLRAFGAQMVLLLAFNSVGVFLSFSVRNTAAVTGIYIAFALVPAMVIGLLVESNGSLAEYYNYDLTMCMKLFSYIEEMSPTEVVRGLAVGIGYIIASTVAGAALFTRAEIK